MRGHRTESIAVHPEHKGAAIAVLDAHPCVLPESVRYSGTMLQWAVDLAALPDGDAPAVCGMIRRDIERAIARRP
jgi:hypothetical protein